MKIMKTYILSLLIIFGAAFSVSAQDQQDQQEDKKEKKVRKNCRAFKNGHFVVKEGLYGNEYTIKRQGDYQIETDQYGVVLTFNVNWTDKCSYILTLEEVQNLERNPTNPDWKEGQVISVNIIDTYEKGYKMLSSSNFDNVTHMTDMVKVDPKTYNKIMADRGFTE